MSVVPDANALIMEKLQTEGPLRCADIMISAFAAGHPRIAISFVAGTLNSAAGFSIAVASAE
jgi:hypothetical protein